MGRRHRERNWRSYVDHGVVVGLSLPCRGHVAMAGLVVRARTLLLHRPVRTREAPIYGCPRYWGFEGPKSAPSLSEFWGFQGPRPENLPKACPFLGI